MKRLVSVLLAIVFVFALGTGASARYLGDVDLDGKVNSNDALLVLCYAVGKDVNINRNYADVNGDGSVDSNDALFILCVAVGKYSTVELPDEFVTSYKKDVVDPIMSTSKYTLKTEVEVEGEKGVITIMVRNGDICVDTETKGMLVRLLCIDSKTYMVIPDFILPGVGVYMESDQEIDSVAGGAGDARYVKSEIVKVDGVEYVCETYELADGTISNYYFKDGKWAMLGTTVDGETNIQKITEFKKGVDDKKFSLNGYVEITPEK